MSIEKAIGWTDYRRGYVSGLTAGDGTYSFTEKNIPCRVCARYWRVALKDMDILIRLRSCLRNLGIRLNIKPFSTEGMFKIESRRFHILEKIKKIIYPSEMTIDFKRGYLAGIFDAEGNWYGSNLRIYNSNQEIRNTIINFASCFGFKFTEENYPSKKANGTRLRGDRFDQASFLCLIKSEKSRWYLRHIFWREL